jgi:hypothetical protein
MFKTFKFKWSPPSALLLVVAGWILWSLLAIRPAVAETFTGVMGERTRITLGYQVKPEILQQMLPSPWQLAPPDSGSLKGANFLVTLTDRIRDEDPGGKPRYSGANRYVVFLAPGRNPRTGQAAIVVLGGLAANPAEAPGYYQVIRTATVSAEHSSMSHEMDTEDVTENWKIRDATGSGEMMLRLRSLLLVSARTQTTMERNIISAKDPTLSRIYKITAATDVVKSVPEGIDRVQDFAFRLTVPEYSQLFDGSERLLGITMAPWYVRQIFVR